jgi:predicted site-specific integrase-resolvase
MPPELDTTWIEWLVRAAVVGVAVLGCAAIKKLMNVYDKKLEQLESDMDTKAEKSDLQGLVNRMTREQKLSEDRIVTSIEAGLTESKQDRAKLTKKMEALADTTQSFQTEMLQRVTRVETVQDGGNNHNSGG